jgi:NarL family two-component system response regulator LiaR
LTNPEIAERLVVTRSTAKAHVSNILSKLGVSNRAEAIRVALQEKLLKT